MALSLLAVLASTQAFAQSRPTVDPKKAATCIYNDKAYSSGAVFCATRNIKITCGDDGKWKPDTDAGACEGFSHITVR